MQKNRIAFACDHWGFELKEILKKWMIEEKNAKVVIDMAASPDSIPDGMLQTKNICEAMQRDELRHAIMICGTGVGFCIIANKYWGVRASNVSDMYTAERARKSQNAQVLTIGAWDLAPEKAKKVVAAWYDEPFNWSRTSSVENLAGFLNVDNTQLGKPEWVRWSMGYSPEDQGEWYYPAKG